MPSLARGFIGQVLAVPPGAFKTNTFPSRSQRPTRFRIYFHRVSQTKIAVWYYVNANFTVVV